MQERKQGEGVDDVYIVQKHCEPLIISQNRFFSHLPKVCTSMCASLRWDILRQSPDSLRKYMLRNGPPSGALPESGLAPEIHAPEWVPIPEHFRSPDWLRKYMDQSGAIPESGLAPVRSHSGGWATWRHSGAIPDASPRTGSGPDSGGF